MNKKKNDAFEKAVELIMDENMRLPTALRKSELGYWEWKYYLEILEEENPARAKRIKEQIIKNVCM